MIQRSHVIVENVWNVQIQLGEIIILLEHFWLKYGI